MKRIVFGGAMGLFASSEKKAMARSRDLFAEAYRQAGVNVQILLRATDLYPIYISSNFERVFAVEPERMEDDVETLLRFVVETDRYRLKNEIMQWDRKKPLVTNASYIMPNSGEEKLFQLRFTSVLEGTHMLMAAIDITTTHAKVDQAVRERDRALAMAQDRTDFLSQMSHEIRTPLNGIQGMISLAMQHLDEKALLADDLARADELSSYLLALINDVLDMSRLNSGRTELEIMPFDMRVIAAEVERMFSSQAKDKGLNYTVVCAECPDHFVMGDKMRLSQVIVNFVSNAIKFTPEGGDVGVSFREMRASDNVASYVIRVHDTGKGMDPRFVSRIFKPFEQEDRSIARRYGGTGLGMPIANGLVELMGGQIVVETELGEGSDFMAYIPFEKANSEQVAYLEQRGEVLELYKESGSRLVEYSFDGRRFLLAEDNEINATITVEMLKMRGAMVDVANDGPVVVDMFEKAASGTYDAILMDIQMPTYNGWEAARRIRALATLEAANIPIIALSANNNAEDARASRAAGMNGHVGKPIDFDELKAQLAAATAEKRLRRND